MLYPKCVYSLSSIIYFKRLQYIVEVNKNFPITVFLKTTRIQKAVKYSQSS